MAGTDADHADSLDFVPLTPDRWDDVAALFGEGGDPKTCWCMYWRLRSKDWSFTNAAATRDGFHALVDEDRDPGARSPRLPRRSRRRLGQRRPARRLRTPDELPRPAADRRRPVWSIVCFVVSRTERGRGLTTKLLDAAMAYATERGAPGLEAYPVDPGEGRVPAALGYTGLLSTFTAAGFRVVHEIDSPQATVRRVIVRREVEP